jgi:signal transduction histidine kinase
MKRWRPTASNVTQDACSRVTDGTPDLVAVDQPFTQRIGDQVHSGTRCRLTHDARAVTVDCLDTNPKDLGDFLIGLSGDHKVEDLAFAVGQRSGVYALLKHGGITSTDHPRPIQNIGQRPGDFVEVVGLTEDAICTDVDQLRNLPARLNSCEDNDLCFGRPAARFNKHFGATSMRHRHIQHQQAWRVFANSGDRFNAINRLSHNLDCIETRVLTAGEPAYNSRADDLMVVGNDGRMGLSETQISALHYDKTNLSSRITQMGIKQNLGPMLVGFVLALAWMLVLPATAQPVLIEAGKSVEQIESAATYLVQPRGEEITVDEALSAYLAGRFEPRMMPDNDGALQDWRTWIALPFSAVDEMQGTPLRRVIGLGGIFVELPRVYLLCDGEPQTEILASRSRQQGPLKARYFTYIRTQSFAMSPGQQCLALINASSNDNPNIGIFREGELGSNQVVAVLIKSGFTVTLLIIGIVLAVVSYLTNRPLAMVMGITYSITMVQNETSLYSTAFMEHASQGRALWEALTLLSVFACYWVFLFAFRSELRLHRHLAWRFTAVAIPLPLIAIAYYSDSTPDLIWSLYLALFLFAISVTLRFDVAPRLRWTAGAILLTCVVAAVLVEPYYLGRYLTDLTVEFSRDVVRLMAGLGMLLLVVFDVLRTRRERDRMTKEQIVALATQAESNRRLLEAEREYARVREVASRHKAQLFSTSHDIRQPIAALKSALTSESANLSAPFLSQANQVIAYLERLTKEYSPQPEHRGGEAISDDEAYPVNIVLRAVEDMFENQAAATGVDLVVDQSEKQTRIPALALIRATSNLVSNAINHGRPRHIRVDVAGEDNLEIVVSDDGIGMDAATLSDALNRGTKGQESEGEGLGLSIVQELANRHGFDFHIESVENKGTTATLQLGARRELSGPDESLPDC